MDRILWRDLAGLIGLTTEPLDLLKLSSNLVGSCLSCLPKKLSALPVQSVSFNVGWDALAKAKEGQREELK